ncbi:MAG TPA: hypothetical protein PK691_13305, partial [Thermomicrobiales bacterium]|nr:hypothetical protein [Thermomicrobiales bacterium]
MIGPYARRLQRRQIIAGLAAVGLPLGFGTRAYTQQTAPTAITDGDCTSEPAVQMLFDWRAGKPVYSSVAEAGPPISWVPSNLPVPMLPYLI